MVGTAHSWVSFDPLTPGRIARAAMNLSLDPTVCENSSVDGTPVVLGSVIVGQDVEDQESGFPHYSAPRLGSSLTSLLMAFESSLGHRGIRCASNGPRSQWRSVSRTPKSQRSCVGRVSALCAWATSFRLMSEGTP